MNSKSKTILGIAAFVILISGASFSYNFLREKTPLVNNINVASSAASSKAGDSSSTVSEPEKVQVPDFTVLNSEGKEVKLSDLFGKPIVMNFWASWCHFCKDEMPIINKVYEELGEDVNFVMVNMVDGGRETMEIGKKYIADNKYTFPVYYDTEQNAAYAYGIRALPTTLFIDKDGYIVTGLQAPIDEATLRKGIALSFEGSDAAEEAASKAVYRKITAQEAKKKLDETPSAILLDVRSQSEYDERHIEGALLIPDTELRTRAEAELTDKDALILVYCRSGNRSHASSILLASLGYTNVYDFGGLESYPYETVSTTTK